MIPLQKIIKPNSLAASERVPHELGKKRPDGKFHLKHPPNCGCDLVYSVYHAPWVSWNGMSGRAFCDRCKAEKDLPMPAVRENWFSKRVFMDIKGVEDDLWRFQQKHENCVEPPPSATPESIPAEDPR